MEQIAKKKCNEPKKNANVNVNVLHRGLKVKIIKRRYSYINLQLATYCDRSWSEKLGMLQT